MYNNYTPLKSKLEVGFCLDIHPPKGNGIGFSLLNLFICATKPRLAAAK